MDGGRRWLPSAARLSRGPIEAAYGHATITEVTGLFRAQLSAAPLKRRWQRGPGKRAEVGLPRSSERGPIEAVRLPPPANIFGSFRGAPTEPRPPLKRE